MKLWIILLAALALAVPAHAQDRADESKILATPLSVTGPVILIYRTSGVRDNGGSFNTGVATSFHCTNLSSQSELLKILVRKFDGTIAANAQFTLTSLRTWTASTHGTVAFNEDAFMSEGTVIDQGVAEISSTTKNMICSAMMLDAASASPLGISLHLVRSNKITGTEE